MGVLPFRRRRSEDSKVLQNLLELAQSGDDEARNELIRTYTPFILRIASQTARRYIDRDRDDEFSIALMGMNEAIDRFDASKQVNFLAFAETIIRRRLIDYFRSQRAQQRSVPWTEFDVADDEDNVVNYIEIKTSLEAHEQAEEQALRRQEIEEYARLLTEFGLSFGDLVDVSPKHQDARRNAMQVARLVAADEEMRRYVWERHALPLKWLEDRAGVSRKTMERQRKYILAIVLLLCGDFQYLKSYIAE
ncbi:MAG: RNA polymerase sigma factor SigI [Thermoflavifilum sp.]|nr:RNA polymerase sigma factor SigI [Thermoflavifilum sp.]MCL6512832.1 RNA polymerase sigma factor SigI [Alicyclobacillus sp.]